MSYKPFEYANEMHYPTLLSNPKWPCQGCAHSEVRCDNFRSQVTDRTPGDTSGCEDIIWQKGEQGRINYITYRLTT